MVHHAAAAGSAACLQAPFLSRVVSLAFVVGVQGLGLIDRGPQDLINIRIPTNHGFLKTYNPYDCVVFGALS